MNIFISQPMTGLTEREIYDARTNEINKIKHNDRWDTKDVDFISSYVSDKAQELLKDMLDIHEQHRIDIVLLAIAIRKLASADIIWMSHGWEESRGCKIEHMVAGTYQIPVYYSDDYNDGR